MVGCALVGARRRSMGHARAQGLVAMAATRGGAASGDTGAMEPELLHAPPTGDDRPADGCGVADGADLSLVELSGLAKQAEP